MRDFVSAELGYPGILVDGNIDPGRLRPLARLGRGRYARIGGMLEPARRSRFVLSSGKASE